MVLGRQDFVILTSIKVSIGNVVLCFVKPLKIRLDLIINFVCFSSKNTIFHSFCLANLTEAQDEKVGIENFELLKVLGTGGKAQEYFHLIACRRLHRLLAFLI